MDSFETIGQRFFAARHSVLVVRRCQSRRTAASERVEGITTPIVVIGCDKEPELMKLNEYEQVAFTYETIEWTWLDPRVAAADSWLQRG